MDREPVVTLKEHFDDKFLNMERRFDDLESMAKSRFSVMDEKLDMLVERETNQRIELAKYSSVSAAISAITAYILTRMGLH